MIGMQSKHVTLVSIETLSSLLSNVGAAVIKNKLLSLLEELGEVRMIFREQTK